MRYVSIAYPKAPFSPKQEVHSPFTGGQARRDAEASEDSTDLNVGLVSTSQCDLGIRSISSFIRQHGYRALMFFLDTCENTYSRDLVNDLLQRLDQCDVIGVSSIHPSFDRTTQLIRSIQADQRFSKRPVIWGGIHPTVAPVTCLQHADIVCRGEGEVPFLEFLEKYRRKEYYYDVRNFWFRVGGKIISNPLRSLPSLSELPPEDYVNEDQFVIHERSLLPSKTRSFKVEHTQSEPDRLGIFVMTTRGCPYHCTYCVNNYYSRLYRDCNSVRKRDLEDVIDWLADLLRSYPSLDYVYFMDDDFFVRTVEEIDLFRRDWSIRISRPFFAHCSIGSISDEKLEALITAGLSVVDMGIQTGSERVNRDIYGRHYSSQDLSRALSVIDKYSHRMEPAWFDFIFNCPWEEEQDILDSIGTIKTLPKPCYVVLHNLQFYPGTELWERARREGYLNTRVTAHNAYEAVMSLQQNSRNYFLNSVIYWLSGKCTETRYGALTPEQLDTYIQPESICYYNKHPEEVRRLNHSLITQSKKFFESRLQQPIANGERARIERH